MSTSQSGLNSELLGEVSYENEGEATMAKANGGHGDGALEGFHGTEFTPLNATAGTLIKVSRNGDELEPSDDAIVEDTKGAPKTPKKRGAAAVANDESSQPTKKRSPTKKATATTNGDTTDSVTPAKKRASAKKKSATEVNANTGDGETDGETEGLEPVTPKKGKRATGKAKVTKADKDLNGESTESTDKSVSPTKGIGAVEGKTVHNTPRKRQAPKNELAVPRSIPTSWDEADPADQMLVTMKEQGEGWNEIRAAWKQLTGQDTASSTLPNRYNRIKVNMMRMNEGDEKHLLAAKKEVEDNHNANFWSNVTAAMERRGADKYPAAFAQKTYKELEAASKADAGTANGVASTSAASSSASAANGSKESNGAKGAKGTTGAKGSNGSKGPKGAKGTDGAKDSNGIKDINEAKEDVDVKEEENTDDGDDDVA